eukprot:7383806-Prymnesium_polylepis.1
MSDGSFRLLSSAMSCASSCPTHASSTHALGTSRVPLSSVIRTVFVPRSASLATSALTAPAQVASSLVFSHTTSPLLKAAVRGAMVVAVWCAPSDA